MSDRAENRFEVDGRGLDFWLWELVCDDMDRRSGAARFIHDVFMAMPTDLAQLQHFDGKASQEEFRSEVRRVLAETGFDCTRFLVELMDFIQVAQAKRMSLIEREFDRNDRIMDKLFGRLGPDPKSKDFERIESRVQKIVCAFKDPKNKDAVAEQALSTQVVAAYFVFDAVNEQLMMVPDRLKLLLQDKSEGRLALQALERIGPVAMQFADFLIRQLDDCDEPYSFQGYKALASVVRDDRASIQRIVDRLGSPALGVATGAASTLGALGIQARVMVPEAVSSLLQMTSRQDVCIAAVMALGKVASELDIAVDRVLELSRDNDPWVKGAALTALGEIGRQPERVIPRLIAAFGDYEEQDPDYGYYSQHGRVVYALQAFGQAAVSAIPALTARVRNSDGDLDRGVVETLGMFGPSARVAMPVLLKTAAEFEYSEEAMRDLYDPLSAAIAKINGNEV